DDLPARQHAIHQPKSGVVRTAQVVPQHRNSRPFRSGLKTSAVHLCKSLFASGRSAPLLRTLTLAKKSPGHPSTGIKTVLALACAKAGQRQLSFRNETHIAAPAPCDLRHSVVCAVGATLRTQPRADRFWGRRGVRQACRNSTRCSAVSAFVQEW